MNDSDFQNTQIIQYFVKSSQVGMIADLCHDKESKRS